MKIKELLDYDLDSLHFEIREMLHRVKYHTEEHVEWFKGIDLNILLKNITEEQFKNLCILATFTQVAFENRGERSPRWAVDKRLYLQKAFVHEHSHYLDIFEAYQAEFNHNVFYPKTAYEVI